MSMRNTTKLNKLQTDKGFGTLSERYRIADGTFDHQTHQNDKMAPGLI